MGPNAQGNRPADGMRTEDQSMSRRVRLTVGLGRVLHGAKLGLGLHDMKSELFVERCHRIRGYDPQANRQVRGSSGCKDVTHCDCAGTDSLCLWYHTKQTHIEVIWLDPEIQYTRSVSVDFDYSSFGRQSEVDCFGASTLFVKRVPSEHNVIAERFIEQPVIEGRIGGRALAK